MKNWKFGPIQFMWRNWQDFSLKLNLGWFGCAYIGYCVLAVTLDDDLSLENPKPD